MPQVRGKKILILDRKVSGFLGLIAEVPLLKEHGVDRYDRVPHLILGQILQAHSWLPHECDMCILFAGYCTCQRSPFKALM